LRGELSAVETYRQAIEKLNDEPQVVSQLQMCMRSHEQRIDAIRQQVTKLGGTPARESGAWGTFTKLVEGGAKLFGKKAAISALEEGEDHGRNDYQRDMAKLSPDLQRFVQTSLLPEQLKTHDTLSRLQKSI
jgi:hypothetical protein